MRILEGAGGFFEALSPGLENSPARPLRPFVRERKDGPPGLRATYFFDECRLIISIIKARTAAKQ
jgi:hypothetical protein